MKVLIIAYAFPPCAAVGIYRTTKFCKYLPAFGWTPVVLTVSNGKHAKYDERTMKLVPEETPVYRAPAIEWFNVGENAKTAGKPRRRTLFSRIYGRLCMISNFFSIPDNNISWVPFAVVKGYRVIKRENIRYVFVTGKPFSSFLIGVMLKKLCGTRLVVDYRDPWTQNINYERRSPVHTWIERKLEQHVIDQSDAVIANTRVNEGLLADEFGRERRAKFTTIHNGFDSEDFGRVAAKRFNKFTLTYAGAFYFAVGSSFKRGAGDEVMKTYSPLFFLEALTTLFQSRPDIRDHMRVNFMGVLGTGYAPVIEELGLADVVRHLGYLEYDEHLAVLKGSDALLLVLSSGEKSRGWIPSKFFSYIGSGNPVLALVPPGEVREIVEEARAGIAVEPDDVAGTAWAIRALYDDYYVPGKDFSRNEAEIDKFDRRYLTSVLARVLDGLDKSASRP